MKKLICMLLALVLMMGAMVLPASAQEAAGKIYKLPGGYCDFVGVGGGVIVCAKMEYDEFYGFEIPRYGAIDETGETIVPFFYHYASAPDENGKFFAAEVYYDEYSSTVRGFLIDENQNATYLSDCTNMSGEVEAEFNDFFVLDDQIVALVNYYDDQNKSYQVSVFDLSTGSLIKTIHIPEGYGAINVFGDSERIVYGNGQTIWYGTYDSIHSIKAVYENQYFYPLGFDKETLYYIDVSYREVNGELEWVNSFYAATPFNVGTLGNWFAVATSDKDMEPQYYMLDDIVTHRYIGDYVQNGKMIAVKDDQYGFVDYKQNIYLPCTFDEILPIYNENMYVACKDGRVTYGKTDGTFTEQYFACGSNFDDGKAFVTDEQGKMSIIDSQFNELAILPESIGEAGVLYLKDDLLVKADSNYTFYVYSEDPDFSVFGDVSKDGLVDVADIMKMKNYIMADDSSASALAVADLNADGRVDVADILKLKALIMSN